MVPVFSPSSLYSSFEQLDQIQTDATVVVESKEMIYYI